MIIPENKMIVDIHAHIFPGIDDGAEDAAMAFEVMKSDYSQGACGIFCTSHSYAMEDMHEHYHGRFNDFRRQAKRFDKLKIYKGCEILCYREEMPDNIDKIKLDIYPTMNETEYVLMEFDPDYTKGTDEMRYCLEYTLDKGYIPIIAHAERYANIYDDPEKDIRLLKELGCMVQINLYSIVQDGRNSVGKSRKALANLFLNNRLVDFAGTDAHRPDYKPPEAMIGADYIRENFDEEYAQAILRTNAQKYLNA